LEVQTQLVKVQTQFAEESTKSGKVTFSQNLVIIGLTPLGLIVAVLSIIASL